MSRLLPATLFALVCLTLAGCTTDDHRLTKQIEIIITPTGATTVQTLGYTGSSCREASGFLEQAPGRQTHETLTAEFHQSQTAQNENRQRPDRVAMQTLHETAQRLWPWRPWIPWTETANGKSSGQMLPLPPFNAAKTLRHARLH